MVFSKEIIQSKVLSIESENKGSITCIYGQSGCGKTYRALMMKALKEIDVILDGDSVRTYLNDDLGYSDEDRKRNNIRIAKIALMLANQGLRVVISTIRADLAYEWLNGKIEKLYKVHLNENHEEIIEDNNSIIKSKQGVVTEQQRKILKEKFTQENEQKMNMIDINPLIKDVRSSEISMVVFQLIGEQGMSQVPLIKEYLENNSIEKGGKSSINVQINNMIRSKILSRENINTGYRRFIVVDFTSIGLRIFEEIFGKSPVESEKRRLKRENVSVEHGFLIQDTITILKKEFGYKKCILKENGFNIIATKNGKLWDNFIIQPNNYQEEDFIKNLNEIKETTQTLYFVFQNKEQLNHMLNEINIWTNKLENKSLNEITFNFSTLSLLNNREWIETISL